MPPYVIALVFGVLGLVAAWAVRHDIAAGVNCDSMYRFRLDDNPVMFTLIVVTKVFIAIFCAAMVLHACGLIGDPLAAIDAAFPWLPKRPGPGHR